MEHYYHITTINNAISIMQGEGIKASKPISKESPKGVYVIKTNGKLLTSSVLLCLMSIGLGIFRYCVIIEIDARKYQPYLRHDESVFFDSCLNGKIEPHELMRFETNISSNDCSIYKVCKTTSNRFLLSLFRPLYIIYLAISININTRNFVEKYLQDTKCNTLLELKIIKLRNNVKEKKDRL